MTETREAPRELLNLACAIRADWTHEETWAAIYAARTAGLEWRRIVTRLVDIAFSDEEPPTRPRELWDDVRGMWNQPGTGVPLDPDVKARLLAELKSKTAPEQGAEPGNGATHQTTSAGPAQAEAHVTETNTNGGTK